MQYLGDVTKIWEELVGAREAAPQFTLILVQIVLIDLSLLHQGQYCFCVGYGHVQRGEGVGNTLPQEEDLAEGSLDQGPGEVSRVNGCGTAPNLGVKGRKY